MLAPLAPPAKNVEGASGILGTEGHRFSLYREARAFADGSQWEGRRRRGEARLTFNYARALVRKVVSYIFAHPVTFSLPFPGDAATVAERWLTDLAGELDLGALDAALAYDASVSGDAAVKVTWDAAVGRPRVVAVDPMTLRAWWSPDEPAEPLRVAQRYQLPGFAIGPAFGVTLSGMALNPDRWYPIEEDWTAARWRVEVAGQFLHEVPNPYGWIPYVVLSNNRPAGEFWGSSDLPDLYDVCRELNSRLTVVSAILNLSGAPIAVLENVDSSEGIAIGPGAKWELPEGAKAYLLDLLEKGGIDHHIKAIDELRTSMHDLAESPRTAFGDSGRDLSGAALEVEIQPLVQRVRRKRLAFGPFYRQRNMRLLDLGERFGGEAFGGLRRTVPIWPSVLPSDRDADVRNSVALTKAGLQARRSAIAALGSEDPDGELALIAAEMAHAAAQPARAEGADDGE